MHGDLGSRLWCHIACMKNPLLLFDQSNNISCDKNPSLRSVSLVCCGWHVEPHLIKYLLWLAWRTQFICTSSSTTQCSFWYQYLLAIFFPSFWFYDDGRGLFISRSWKTKIFCCILMSRITYGSSYKVMSDSRLWKFLCFH